MIRPKSQLLSPSSQGLALKSQFATETGEQPQCDPRMLEGSFLYESRFLSRTRAHARKQKKVATECRNYSYPPIVDHPLVRVLVFPDLLSNPNIYDAKHRFD
jgi:hypothetical protein